MTINTEMGKSGTFCGILWHLRTKTGCRQNRAKVMGRPTPSIIVTLAANCVDRRSACNGFRLFVHAITNDIDCRVVEDAPLHWDLRLLDRDTDRSDTRFSKYFPRYGLGNVFQ